MATINCLLGVIHTTVADFDGIPVEDFRRFFGGYIYFFIIP